MNKALFIGIVILTLIIVGIGCNSNKKQPETKEPFTYVELNGVPLGDGVSKLAVVLDSLGYKYEFNYNEVSKDKQMAVRKFDFHGYKIDLLIITLDDIEQFKGFTLYKFGTETVVKEMAQNLADKFPILFNFSWDTTGSYSDYCDIKTVKIAPGFTERVRSQTYYKSDLRFYITIHHSEDDKYYVVASAEVCDVLKLKEYNKTKRGISK